MLYRYFLIPLCLINISYAGLIGSAIGVAKDKAVEKAKEEAIDIYKQRKEIRREKEEISGNKSLLSKSEDKADKAKEKITKVKTLAKETAVESVGKENVEYLKKAKTQMKDTLIGKPIN
jgi:hypothetical protein